MWNVIMCYNVYVFKLWLKFLYKYIVDLLFIDYFKGKF